MATANYDWELPPIGAGFGAWGTILNEIIGGTTPVLGIDGVLAGISTDVVAAQADADAIDVRVTALEAAGAAETFYARLYRSGNQSVSSGSAQQVSFNATSFDQGSLVSGASFVLPTGADGVYEIRAQIEGDFHVSGDDARSWVLEIRKDGLTVATARTPALNDGAFGSGGEMTLRASYFDPAAAAGAVYTVFVTSSSGSPQLTGTADATFFEAVRLIAA